METKDFKKRLDNREFCDENAKEMWEAAYKWQEQANEEDDLIKWSWDCGLKLDYNGDVCRISSRFYPPHKNHAEYGKYYGVICVMIGDGKKYRYIHEIEVETLDELQKLAEDFVSKTIDKMHNALRSVF